MRVTNTKPWWDDFERKIICTGPRYTEATLNAPGQREKTIVHYFLNLDTRQDYYVVMPECFLEEVDMYTRQAFVAKVLKMYLKYLAPSVRVICLDDDQRLLSLSSNPAELLGIPETGINTLFSDFAWPRFESVAELRHRQTVNRSRLVEVDRPAPRVDIMEDTCRDGELIVVKWFLAGARATWREMFTVNSIPAHPHITQRILEIDKSQFKMKWLRQLTDTLDYLHLDLGILHADLQLKNIVVDKAADKLMLIDFENAVAIEEEQLQWEFNQVTWSVYEIVTHDIALVEEQLYDHSKPEEELWACDATVINEMPEWPVRTNLDCEAHEIRQHIRSWIERRKSLPITTPKTPIKPCTGRSPKPSRTVEQSRQAHKRKFEEIQECQDKLQKEKELLPVGNMRWERPPYATAFPDRAEKAIKTSTATKGTPGNGAAAPTEHNEPQGTKRKPKKSKVSSKTVEDVACANGSADSETIDIPIISDEPTTTSTRDSQTASEERSPTLHDGSHINS
ncbi:hypothetical protein F5X97DRAFT_334383 [Nemania serpens]|nr:hypothetical protein F5X97DRAFT_334383 [Nemania serpens]